MAGMIKEKDIDVASAIAPIRNVPIAPPIGVIIKREDASLTELGFTLAIVMANMVGNIIASKA